MLKLRDGIIELYRKTATSLPPDVENALIKARKSEEKGSNAEQALKVILDNITIARNTSRPICQDTGVPVFYVSLPRSFSQLEIENTIIEATRIATEKIPLRPNAVDIITEKNSGDNTGVGYPVIYFKESQDNVFTIDLMLKGGGSENVGQTYKLPMSELNAGRDFDGVRKCVLDAVQKSQGKGCPPYTIGVAIGAAKDQVTKLSKSQLLRKIDDINPISVLAGLEIKLLKEINKLGIGTMGFGGRTTAIAVKVAVNHRHPASYFVDISIACWANRRGILTW
ncbi:MAG: fumarate hydratase [Nitrospiraceae bacterium]|nr:fumarate hydratase [Nitrospiraceae bacterium]